MKTKETILFKHVDYKCLNYDGYTEDVLKAMDEYRLEILEEVKIGFDLCSDTSAFCLGYRNLVDRIRREKENKPIDKSISPIKPSRELKDILKSWDDEDSKMELNTDNDE